jgi:hypothetical protein
MDSIRHAFSKSRSSPSTSSPSGNAKPHAGGEIATPKTPSRGASISSKRDSGLSALGTTNGRNHSRKPSGASSSRSQDQSFTSNGSLNGMFISTHFDFSERQT